MPRAAVCLALAAALLAACRQQDIRVVPVQVPGLSHETGARLIEDAVMRQPGVKAVRPDIARRTVTVTYDSMVIAKKNIEYAIAQVGFDANDIKADPAAAARLPPEGRPGPEPPGP